MNIPIKPEIKELDDNVILITLHYPSWNIKSLLRWIFTRTVEYDCWYEIKYKVK